MNCGRWRCGDSQGHSGVAKDVLRGCSRRAAVFRLQAAGADASAVPEDFVGDIALMCEVRARAVELIERWIVLLIDMIFWVVCRVS